METHLTYLGYRTASSGAPVGADGCGLCVFSKTLSAATPASPGPILVLDGAALVGAILSRRRGRNGVSDATVFLLAVSAISLLAAVFGEGSYEEIKHLYLFYVANLLLIALTAGSYVDLLRSRARRRPKDSNDRSSPHKPAEASAIGLDPEPPSEEPSVAANRIGSASTPRWRLAPLQGKGPLPQDPPAAAPAHRPRPGQGWLGCVGVPFSRLLRVVLRRRRW